MGALEGRVAVITGSTSGIGARTAELFASEGARLVISGRREKRGRQRARTLGQAANFIRADVSNEAEVEAMIAHAVTTFGRLDCLINNAGSGSGYQEIAKMDLQRFDDVIRVHVRCAGCHEICHVNHGCAEDRQHYQRGKRQWHAGRIGRPPLLRG